MENESQTANILVWLPSPMGDAVLCTPALRALRRRFESARITFLARAFVREILSGIDFNDTWLQVQSTNPFAIAKIVRPYKFTHAVLFKNSFASALSVFLAGIPSRIGYSRECRKFLLSDKLYPTKLSAVDFKPLSMIDYYLAIASWLGCDTDDRSLMLFAEPRPGETLRDKLPELAKGEGPIVILVPGGAFGPSKCWPGERFAQTASYLISEYGATVVVSVSPAAEEKQIAKQICDLSGHNLVNLADRGVSISELKSLFSNAALVITNDTGPRHIAIAFGRRVITLFGPNNPGWTETGSENEIQIIGEAACAPCDKPVCKKSEHLCMEAITVEMVCEAAEKLLEEKPTYEKKDKVRR